MGRSFEDGEDTQPSSSGASACSRSPRAVAVLWVSKAGRDQRAILTLPPLHSLQSGPSFNRYESKETRIGLSGARAGEAWPGCHHPQQTVTVTRLPLPPEHGWGSEPFLPLLKATAEPLAWECGRVPIYQS